MTDQQQPTDESNPLDPIVAFLRLRRRQLRAEEPQRGKRYTQAWVAEQLGVAQVTVCGWELGNSIPRLPLLRAWAASLGYDLGVVPQQAAA